MRTERPALEVSWYSHPARSRATRQPTSCVRPARGWQVRRWPSRVPFRGFGLRLHFPAEDSRRKRQSQSVRRGQSPCSGLEHRLTRRRASPGPPARSEEHTSELQSQSNLVCRLLLERKNRNATSLNSRIKSLHTLIVKIIIVTFISVIRTNHKKASKVWRQ